MKKRTAHALALVLSATPLLLIGCGDSDNKGGTGGTIGGTGGAMKYDGGNGGAGGAKLDVGVADTVAPALDTAPTPAIDTGLPNSDVALLIDTTPAVDAGIPDAPIGPDAPILFDTAAVDAPKALDTGAVDTVVAIDSPPVCTMTTPFTGGDVIADLTLTAACSPYTIKTNIAVSEGATLTIEAGVTMKMGQDVQIDIGYSTVGKLIVKGTASAPVTFTSPTAGAGDWVGIVFWSSAANGTKLSYALLDYCGQPNTACLRGEGVKAGRVSVDHVTIDHVGTGANGIQEDDADSNFTISNCTFSNIPKPPSYAISVLAPSFAGIDSTNTFNGGAMVEVAGGTIATTTDWKNPKTPVAVTANLILAGTPAPVLTIAAGTTLKFAQDKGFDIGNGAGGNLKVNGTALAQVVFTSLNTPAAAGDWLGLMFWSSAKGTLTYTTVEFGGSKNGSSSTSGDISVDTTGVTLDVSNSTLSNSASYGLYFPCTTDSTPSVVTTTNVTYTADLHDNGPGPTGTDCL